MSIAFLCKKSPHFVEEGKSPNSLTVGGGSEWKVGPTSLISGEITVSALQALWLILWMWSYPFDAHGLWFPVSLLFFGLRSPSQLLHFAQKGYFPEVFVSMGQCSIWLPLPMPAPVGPGGKVRKNWKISSLCSCFLKRKGLNYWSWGGPSVNEKVLCPCACPRSSMAIIQEQGKGNREREII